MRLPTLSIGIPAYNEEFGIKYLLADISSQESKIYNLEKIIVYSDGSTDGTINSANSFATLPLKVINGKKRKGKANALNEIFNSTASDILVIFDSDIRLADNHAIDELIRPIILENSDLTGAKVLALRARNWFGRLLNTSLEWKLQLFEKINKGNNIYTCHGRARGFSKRLYQSIKFKESINEDAYSYLYSIYHKYRYSYAPKAVIKYTSPLDYADHKLQSIRFFQSMTSSINEFGKEFVDSAYKIPSKDLVTTLLPFSIKHPSMLIYLLFTIYLKIKSGLIDRFDNTWNISKTSKGII